MRLRTLRICVVVYAILNLNKPVYAQCPDGGAPLTTSYSTAEHINFGDASSTYTFPQFNPSLGTLLKVEVNATINGQAVDYLENNLNTATSYTVQIVRYDSIFGPSITPPLSSKSTKDYGPFTLGASDNLGIPNFNGPDFIQLGPDIIPNNKILNRNITGAAMSPYVGIGNVSFNYKSGARAVITGSANNTNTIAASTDITLQITYVYCPTSILAINNLDFGVRKGSDRTVKIFWTKDMEQAHLQYDLQMSAGGKDFTVINTVESRLPEGSLSARYEFTYTVPEGIYGNIQFRLKQTDAAGVVDYSPVRSIEIGRNNMNGLALSVFPNPASQHINIKFSSMQNGTLLLELVNSVGQVIESFRVNGNTDLLNWNLRKQYQPGIYFVNIHNLSNGQQSVVKLLIR